MKYSIVFILFLLFISSCNAATKQTQAEFDAEQRIITNSSLINAQLSAYSKNYFDLADIYVLQLKVGDKTIKVTSLKAIEISSTVNTSRSFFTFTKPKNYLIFYSYDALSKQAYEMRIASSSLQTGQFTEFPVLDEKTGKVSPARITLLKIQHK